MILWAGFKKLFRQRFELKFFEINDFWWCSTSISSTSISSFTPSMKKSKDPVNHPNQDLVLCLESCSDSECQASCNREHVSCFSGCPCNNDCETGCDRCENPICKAVLVLNTYRVRFWRSFFEQFALQHTLIWFCREQLTQQHRVNSIRTNWVREIFHFWLISLVM